MLGSAARGAGTPSGGGSANGVICAVLAAAAALAWPTTVATAQEASASPAETKSFLTIIFQGAEWPGAIIFLLSITAVALIVEHFITIRRSTMAPAAEVDKARALIEAQRFRECVDLLRSSRTMFAHVLTRGLQHGRHGFDAMFEAADETAAAWSNRLFRRAEYLNVVGNIGPLMGLLGTVLGMIEAFGQMQASHGDYKTEDLAGGISLALVNTFLGLALAIVGLAFFGVCRNRVDRFTVEARAAALEILEYFRNFPATASGAAAPATAARPTAPAPQPPRPVRPPESAKA